MKHLLSVGIRARLMISGALGRGRGRRDERGDVPGWVLVTVMTAGLVMALWGLADKQLPKMLGDALDSVKR
jgi:hypothetical protein